jgi:quercetin dioxygenase-like cupin family protein
MNGVVMNDCIISSSKIKKRKDLAPSPMCSKSESYKDVEYFPLITSRLDDAQNFSMRLFKIRPNGFTSKHSHSYEHEVYILNGEGFIYDGNEKIRIEKDDCFIIHPFEVHQLLADQRGLDFICVVPNKLKNQPE